VAVSNSDVTVDDGDITIGDGDVMVAPDTIPMYSYFSGLVPTMKVVVDFGQQKE